MRIAVLRGGPGHEYDYSLSSGECLIDCLNKEGHQVTDVLVDKEGVWHAGGLPTSRLRLEPHVDHMWSVLEGEGDMLGARLSQDKVTSKRMFAEAGLLVPQHALVNRESDLDAARRELMGFSGGPYVVKPRRASSSLGVKFVKEPGALAELVRDSLLHHDELLVENHMHGREYKCGVVEAMRGDKYYSLPVVEVEKASSYEAAYPGDVSQVLHVPARLSREETVLLQETALRAHRALNPGPYSMVDIILSKRGPVVLELDSNPHLYEGSYTREALRAIGGDLQDLL